MNKLLLIVTLIFSLMGVLSHPGELAPHSEAQISATSSALPLLTAGSPHCPFESNPAGSSSGHRCSCTHSFVTAHGTPMPILRIASRYSESNMPFYRAPHISAPLRPPIFASPI